MQRKVQKSFYLTSALLFLCMFVLGGVDYTYAQTCNCATCNTLISVGAGDSYTVALATPCPSGEVAVISNLNVMSTDGSTFTVYSKDTSASTTYYTAGSSPNAITCFPSTFGENVGGLANTISVTFNCQNFIESCPLNYGVMFSCIASSSSSSGTNSAHSDVRKCQLRIIRCLCEWSLYL